MGMSESMANPGAASLDPGANPLAAFGKYGLPGLVIAVLFFFMWNDRNASREDAKTAQQVIQKNTEVMVEFKGVMTQMREAMNEYTEEIRKLREERRNRK
jgi:hypothetical protein